MESNLLIEKILNSHNVEFNNIEKVEIGFTNDVYFIDDKFVLKLLKPNTKRKKILKEIDFYKTFNHFEFIPKLAFSGVMDESDYLIIEKLNTKSLYEFWHLINSEQRDKLVVDIVNIMKSIHNTQYKEFAKRNNIAVESWEARWIRGIGKNISYMESMDVDTSRLEELKTICPIIFKQEKMVLVHNDLHFDNLLLDNNNNLKLIDFDRVLEASSDYEFVIFDYMCIRPSKFASEETEVFTKLEDYIDIMPKVKKLYPEIFDYEYFDERQTIYKLTYELGNAYEIEDSKKRNETITNIINQGYENEKIQKIFKQIKV
jgi:serine/threonine protein kinase